MQALQAQVRVASRGRLPGLDGIRAVSITLVIISHMMIHSIGLVGRPRAVQFAYGEDGVVFFFALSGFLITTLLLREHKQRGQINLGSFYLRRCLRIWPVWYAYLAFVAILVLLGWDQVNERSWIGAATFSLNLLPGTDGVSVAHAWSLAIEEQFYLLWPLTLIVLLRTRHPLRTLAVVVFTAPVWRWLIWFLLPAVRQFGNQATQNRAGALLAGCLVALLLAEPRWRDRYRTAVSRGGAVLAVLILLAQPFVGFASGRHAELFNVTIGLSMSDLPLAFLVGAVAVSPTSAAVRFLSWWPVALLGLMSYSLYVWQQVFVLQPAIPVVIGLAASLLAGYASWRVIEMGSARVKDRMLRAPSPASRG